VTKKLKTRFSYLDLLTRFLNFDFGSGDARQIKKFFRDRLVEARFLPNQKARRLQIKLKQELLPIIAPKDRPDRQKAEERLSRLVARINKMVFKPTWSVEFIDDWDLKYEPFPGEKLPQFPVPPLLKILGGTWYVSKMPDLNHRGPLEDFLWWTVIDAMETGELAKLKTCGLCEKFFLQDDIRQEFCSEKCRYDFHNRTRQNEGYFRKKRKERRDLMLKKAKALLRARMSPPEVSTKTKLSLSLLRREGLLKSTRDRS
jgi:hypothetical protein